MPQSKSTGRSSDSGDGDSKASPPNHCGNSKEDLTSTVREISQARLLTLRKKKSGQSIMADSPDNGNGHGDYRKKGYISLSKD